MLTERMVKLDRPMAFVRALAEATEGVTLHEIDEQLSVNCCTARPMSDVVSCIVIWTKSLTEVVSASSISIV